MRSRVALLHSRRRLPSPTTALRASIGFSSSSSAGLPRSVGSSRFSESSHSSQQQLASSPTTPPSEDDSSSSLPSTTAAPKPKRKYTRSSATAVEDDKPEATAAAGSASTTTTTGVSRAPIREILWQHHDSPPPPARGPDGEDPFDAGLPEPWLLQDAYEALLLALHPQTQHRATYSTSNGLSAEPTIGMYCPIEGGDYVIDATVRNLAQKAKADVVVIDAVELSAGEHGMYGKAASVFQFPDNPLKEPSPPSFGPSFRSRRPPGRDEQDDDDDGVQSMFMGAPTAFTIHMPGGSEPLVRSSRNGSGSMLSPMSRGGSSMPMQPVKAFFDDLLNLTNPSSESASASAEKEKSSDSLRRPRIVYVRNYPHIAGHVPSWFPGLQAAVRARRQGPMSRPTSPVTGPTVVILGSCPPLSADVPSSSSSSSSQSSRGFGGPNSIMSLLAGAAGGRMPPAPVRTSFADLSWGEKDRKSRERRLKDRLKRWQSRGSDGILDEIPPFSPQVGAAPTAGRRPPGSGMGFPLSELSLGGNVLALPMRLSDSGSSSSSSSGGGDPNALDGYFRVVGVVPRTRNERLERYTRMTKRLKGNELALKLAVAEAGGLLGGEPKAGVEGVMEILEGLESQSQDAASAATSSSGGELTVETSEPQSQQLDALKGLSFIDSCTLSFKPYRDLKIIADTLVGSALSTHAADKGGLLALDPFIDRNVPSVNWDHVSRAVESNAESRTMRNAWIESLTSASKEAEELGPDGMVGEGAVVMPEVDEVVEAIRKDPDLDPHEQRLLGCIVNPATMPTSFKSVHLPANTIDAVRTMVSLPLLFPHAFSTGILKTHAMEGALLFGPPGTGKTLLARAIARESGARMMIIKPSDVMDMYVGEGEKLVRSVFTLARRLSPAVVFIDEIDALFGARVSNRESGGTMAHRGIITEFMQEMDGLKSSRDTRVIVVGATNRPFDLDDAVLRRLPRRILVDLPGPKEREEILKILLKDEILGDDVDLASLGVKTESFSGSDLKYLCIAAALDAVKESVNVPWAVSSNPSVAAISAPSTTEAVSLASETTPSDPSTIPSSAASDALSSSPSSSSSPPTPSPRTLHDRHFVKALHEITPSASESLGTLASLRRWNEEFGEGAAGTAGRRARRRGWGDKFGFGLPGAKEDLANIAGKESDARP